MSGAVPKGAHQVAKQILDLMREARFEVGHHLREQQLADVIGLSRTPVRAALALLQSQGVLEARPNKGYFLAMPWEALHRIELTIPPTGDQVLYDCIVKDRLAGRLPETLMQADLAKRYAVDRVTMMKALMRLAEDGILARNKGRGWVFQPALGTLASLKGSYDFRAALEPQGLLLGTFAAQKPALEASRREHLYLLDHPNLSSVTPSQLFETDARFHEMLAEFTGNTFFLQAIQQQNRLRRLLEFNGYSDRRRIREWCKEHLSILEALDTGDIARAAELLRRHLSHAFGVANAISRYAQQDSHSSPRPVSFLPDHPLRDA